MDEDQSGEVATATVATPATGRPLVVIAVDASKQAEEALKCESHILRFVAEYNIRNASAPGMCISGGVSSPEYFASTVLLCTTWYAWDLTPKS